LEELLQQGVEVERMIDDARDDQRICVALPAAATKAGAYTPTSLQRALKQRGLNVTRSQAGRMLRVLRARGRIL
jgi:hypothetical protein